MEKVYKKLTNEQKERGVIFSSCLSKERTEQSSDMPSIHEVLSSSDDKNATMDRLLDDKFFNSSPWTYNIIRRWVIDYAI